MTDPYIFSTEELPSDPRYMPPLVNGTLGWRVFHNIMHKNGIYNGEGGECHRADIPCPLAVRMTAEGKQTYSLDTRTGTFTHSILTSSGEASQQFYAHRQYANLMVMELQLKRQMTSKEPITVMLDSSFMPQSEDITFENAPDYKEGKHIFGQTLSAEFPGCPCPYVHLIWTPVPSSVTLLPDQSQSSWYFLVAVSESSECAQSGFDTGLHLIACDHLKSSHVKAWEEIWEGSTVELEGPEYLTRAVISCMFYLLSAFPSLTETHDQFWGVSPGGLSNGGSGPDQCYWGHVFWDQDTWMYPCIALIYPKLARAALDYRVQTIEGARINAQKLSYKGLKYAWESAVSGQDVCPEELLADTEIHINGDVSFAFQQYFYLTQDLEMFKAARGSEVVWGIADYWASRAVWCPDDQQYHINGVVPPDEYVTNVNNSVYTNSMAKNSLQFALEIADLLQHPAPIEWQNVADKLKIPFDPDLKYHPEYDGYQRGTLVKQADVVLVGFPLGVPMSLEVRKNDLEYYESVTDPKGPAMTWSMFAVSWLELGQAERAQLHLKQCFKNIQAPFNVWSEVPEGSGAVNFLTGMGGFLQTVLFGYTGFRIQRDCLSFGPLLPEEVTMLNVKGISYLGNKLDVLVNKQEFRVVLREPKKDSRTEEPLPLEIVLSSCGQPIPLKPGQPVTFPWQPGKIQKQGSASSCWPL